MAQKVVVELVDDLDGSASSDITTVDFGLDGVEYKIDLTDRNAERLRDTLAEFIGAARRTSGRQKRPNAGARPGTRTPVSNEQTAAVRAWARRNGHDVADRGRIPAHIVTAFEAAQATPPPVTKRPRKKR